MRMLDTVGLQEFRQDGRRRRRETLLAALEATGSSQADLIRKLTLAGEKTAVTTVNRWCTGVGPIDEDTLRFVLTVLELGPDWQPPSSH